jgi:hypothetical protein
MPVRSKVENSEGCLNYVSRFFGAQISKQQNLLYIFKHTPMTTNCTPALIHYPCCNQWIKNDLRQQGRISEPIVASLALSLLGWMIDPWRLRLAPAFSMGVSDVRIVESPRLELSTSGAVKFA